MRCWAKFRSKNCFKANIFIFSLHILLKCAVKLVFINRILISETNAITIQADITMIIYMVIAIMR